MPSDYHGRKAAGLCVGCGLVPPAAERVRCDDCAAALAEVKRNRRKALAAMGRCTVCGVGVPAPGARTCGNCREDDQAGYERRGEAELARRRTANAARRAEVVAAGLCRSCCKRKPRPGLKTCDRCIARINLAAARKRVKHVGPRPKPVWHWPKGRPMSADHPWRRLDRAGVRKTQFYRAKYGEGVKPT